MFTRHKGEVLLVIGAIAFAFNGIVSKLLLQADLSEWRLVQVRTGGAFLFLFTYVLLRNAKSLKVTKKELPLLITYSVFGFALVQFGYFIAISRMNISMALIIEFTAPIWIVLWIKYVRKAFVPKDMWIAIALALFGLILVAKVWQGFAFDLIGTLGAIGAAMALAIYFLMSQSLGTKRSAQAMVVWGMGFAGLFWSLVLPIWNFPTEIFTTEINLQGRFSDYSAPGWLLIAYIIIFGTIVPYLFVVGGIRRLSASTSSVIGMLEPVIAGVFAWIWLSQSWSVIQLAGGAIVLVGIYIADRAKSNAK